MSRLFIREKRISRCWIERNNESNDRSNRILANRVAELERLLADSHLASRSGKTVSRRAIESIRVSLLNQIRRVLWFTFSMVHLLRPPLTPPHLNSWTVSTIFSRHLRLKSSVSLRHGQHLRRPLSERPTMILRIKSKNSKRRHRSWRVLSTAATREEWAIDRRASISKWKILFNRRHWHQPLPIWKKEIFSRQHIPTQPSPKVSPFLRCSLRMTVQSFSDLSTDDDIEQLQNLLSAALDKNANQSTSPTTTNLTC